MAVVGKQALAQGRRVASDPEEIPRAASRGRSLLAVLLGRGLSRLTHWIAPVGRFSLYVGLLLVALTALRLPGETGALADVFLLVSMVCALLLLIQGRPLKVGLLRTHAIGVGLVVAGVAISTLAESADDWQSLLRLGKFLFAATATIVTCMVLVDRRSQLRRALGCWVVSAAITSIAALLQAGLGDPLVSDDALWSRMIGLSQNPNGLGTIAAMAVAGGLTLAVISDRLQSVLWLVTTLLCIAGVVVSASRTGAIIAIVVVAIWGSVFYRLKRDSTILLLGCCLAGAAVASFVYVQIWSGTPVTERLAAASDPYAAPAIAGRLYQYEDVVGDALRNPMVGVGLAEDEVAIRGQEIHNTFLMMLRAGGLLAFAGMIVILGDFLLKGFYAYTHSRSSTFKSLATALSAAVVGMLLSGMAGPLLYQREKWVPAALLFSLLAFSGRRIYQGHASIPAAPKLRSEAPARKPSRRSTRRVSRPERRNREYQSQNEHR